MPIDRAPILAPLAALLLVAACASDDSPPAEPAAEPVAEADDDMYANKRNA